MTYSLLAIDPAAGQIGVAVQSHYFGVGALVPWAAPGVGVVATQSVVRPSYGPQGLSGMKTGAEPSAVLDSLVAADPGAALRQVAFLAVDGRGATHTGQNCIGSAGHRSSAHCRAQANLVARPAVWESMVDTFETTSGTLALRMLAAMEAAEAAGGDLRGRQAAAIRIVRTIDSGDLAADTILDLRVDDDPAPLAELRRLHDKSFALAGLVGMLEAPGLLGGPPTAAADTVDQALADLSQAQQILGADNLEPTIWRALILGRFGRMNEARTCISTARTAGFDPAPLLHQLAAAGMWHESLDPLETLFQ